MRLADYIALAIRVLSDFRVIAATVVVILSWALFRYVGIIVTRRRRPPRMLSGAAPPPEEVKAAKTGSATEE